MQYTKKRNLIAAVGTEIKKLSEAQPTLDVSAAMAALAELESDLGYGPEPETRACPKCHRLGIKQATVCGFCWTKTPVHTAAPSATV